MSTALSRPMLVEMNPSARSSRTMAESASGAVLSELTTATDNAHNGVRQTPSVRLGAAKPSKDVRAGLVSHLRQLIDSHETGTAKVLGLEERLGKIRDQFQDRMIAQEQRITEMDRALQEKGKLLNESRKPKPQTGASTQFS